MAIALIHDPELLILDEPTVGLDPVLRQTIWDYLLKLVSEQNKTIIITTHYIEEAKQAHMVSLCFFYSFLFYIQITTQVRTERWFRLVLFFIILCCIIYF